MNDRLSALAGWVTEAGLAGMSETAMLDGFCRRANAAGLPIARAATIIDTLHPVHEGRAFLWRRDDNAGQTEQIEYGPSSEGETAESWRRSTFFHMIVTGGSQLRRRLAAGEPADFPAIVAMQDEGMTDYLALITRFAAPGVIGEMDCVYSYWATDQPNGFEDRQIGGLVKLMPMLGLALKCVSLARIAGTLV
jgi:adenylate cyclase